MGDKPLICRHEYEIYGRKSPVKIKYRGKNRLGTIFYLRCLKCDKVKQKAEPWIEGDII